MELSVICGHVFKNVLDVMIFTKRTETARDAFWRYHSTAQRMNSWLATDIFDPSTEGHRQIKNTNRIHRAVAMKISKSEPQPENHRWVSQSDLAHVLIGFAGPIVVAPSYFGVTDIEGLTAYIHTWRVLGNVLGIDDKFNPFEGSLKKVQSTIGEVTVKTLFPGLENPPDGFWHHTDMICDWAGSRDALITYSLFCYEKACHDCGATYDEKKFKNMRQRFQLTKFYDYFQFTVCLIVFHYLYQYDAVKLFYNWFAFNRIVVWMVMIQLFFQESWLKTSQTVESFFRKSKLE